MAEEEFEPGIRVAHTAHVMLVVAGFATSNMGAAFLAGIILHQGFKRECVKV